MGSNRKVLQSSDSQNLNSNRRVSIRVKNVKTGQLAIYTPDDKQPCIPEGWIPANSSRIQRTFKTAMNLRVQVSGNQYRILDASRKVVAKGKLNCGVGDDGWWDSLGTDDTDSLVWYHQTLNISSRFSDTPPQNVVVEKAVILTPEASSMISRLPDAIQDPEGFWASGRDSTAEPYALMSIDIDGEHLEVVLDGRLNVLGEFNALLVKSYINS